MENQTTTALWNAVQEADGAQPPVPPSANEFLPAQEGPDFEALESALAFLSPDADDDRTWQVYRIAPLANAATDYPHLRGRLYELAVRYSSGQLGGTPSQAWAKRGAHGTARRNRIGEIWKSFLRSDFTGKRVQLGSIFWQAKEAGWPGVVNTEGTAE